MEWEGRGLCPLPRAVSIDLSVVLQFITCIIFKLCVQSISNKKIKKDQLAGSGTRGPICGHIMGPDLNPYGKVEHCKYEKLSIKLQSMFTYHDYYKQSIY